jgi:mannose-6-phosphate isomerase
MQTLKLSPDRFTPLARTPWAGERIFEKYKKNLVVGASRMAIGEAWEISCDPDFPSRVLGVDQELLGYIQKDPENLLSRSYVERKGATCEILVKLLNAASPLSVQVHPTDDDPSLKAHECGKPESWLVLEAEAGAGLYLGFSQPITKEKLRSLLQADADLRPYLQFVAVKPGDYFEIQPGVPHAIGPGVTLLEPQRVLLGKSGKTYRFWDWGRRYRADGSLDMEAGKPRELHIEEGLRLIDPEGQVGEDFVSTLRRSPEVFPLLGGGEVRRYPANSNYQVFVVRLSKGQKLRWAIQDGFATLISLSGRFHCESASGERVAYSLGEPGFLPYASFPMTIEAEDSSEWSMIVPMGTQLSWSL